MIVLSNCSGCDLSKYIIFQHLCLMFVSGWGKNVFVNTKKVQYRLGSLLKKKKLFDSTVQQ